jgi:hypothetical protein
LLLGGRGVKNYDEAVSKMGKFDGSTNAAFQEQLKSANNQIKEMAIKFKLAQDSMGAGIFEFFAPLIKEVNKLLDAFNSLPDPVKKTAGVIVALSAVAAGLIATAAILTITLGTTSWSIKQIGLESTGSSVRVGLFGGALEALKLRALTLGGALSFPFMLVGGLATQLIERLAGVGSRIAGFFAPVTNVLSRIFGIFANTIAFIGRSFANVFAPVIQPIIANLSRLVPVLGWVAAAIGAFAIAYKTNFLGIKDNTDMVMAALEPTWNWFKSQMEELGWAVQGFTLMASESYTNLINWYNTSFVPAWNAGVNWLVGTFFYLVAIIDEALRTATGIFVDFSNWLVAGFVANVENIIEGGFAGIWSNVVTIFNNAISSLVTMMKNFGSSMSQVINSIGKGLAAVKDGALAILKDPTSAEGMVKMSESLEHFKSIGSTVSGAFSGIGRGVKGIMDGVVRHTSNGAMSAMNAFSQIGKGADQFLKRAKARSNIYMQDAGIGLKPIKSLSGQQNGPFDNGQRNTASTKKTVTKKTDGILGGQGDDIDDSGKYTPKERKKRGKKSRRPKDDSAKKLRELKKLQNEIIDNQINKILSDTALAGIDSADEKMKRLAERTRKLNALATPTKEGKDKVRSQLKIASDAEKEIRQKSRAVIQETVDFISKSRSENYDNELTKKIKEINAKYLEQSRKLDKEAISGKKKTEQKKELEDLKKKEIYTAQAQKAAERLRSVMDGVGGSFAIVFDSSKDISEKIVNLTSNLIGLVSESFDKILEKMPRTSAAVNKMFEEWDSFIQLIATDFAGSETGKAMESMADMALSYWKDALDVLRSKLKEVGSLVVSFFNIGMQKLKQNFDSISPYFEGGMAQVSQAINGMSESWSKAGKAITGFEASNSLAVGTLSLTAGIALAVAAAFAALTIAYVNNSKELKKLDRENKALSLSLSDSKIDQAVASIEQFNIESEKIADSRSFWDGINNSVLSVVNNFYAMFSVVQVITQALGPLGGALTYLGSVVFGQNVEIGNDGRKKEDLKRQKEQKDNAKKLQEALDSTADFRSEKKIAQLIAEGKTEQATNMKMGLETAQAKRDLDKKMDELGITDKLERARIMGEMLQQINQKHLGEDLQAQIEAGNKKRELARQLNSSIFSQRRLEAGKQLILTQDEGKFNAENSQIDMDESIAEARLSLEELQQLQDKVDTFAFFELSPEDQEKIRKQYAEAMSKAQNAANDVLEKSRKSRKDSLDAEYKTTEDRLEKELKALENKRDAETSGHRARLAEIEAEEKLQQNKIKLIDIEIDKIKQRYDAERRSFNEADKSKFKQALSGVSLGEDVGMFDPQGKRYTMTADNLTFEGIDTQLLAVENLKNLEEITSEEAAKQSSDLYLLKAKLAEKELNISNLSYEARVKANERFAKAYTDWQKTQLDLIQGKQDAESKNLLDEKTKEEALLEQIHIRKNTEEAAIEAIESKYTIMFSTLRTQIDGNKLAWSQAVENIKGSIPSVVASLDPLLAKYQEIQRSMQATGSYAPSSSSSGSSSGSSGGTSGVISSGSGAMSGGLTIGTVAKNQASGGGNVVWGGTSKGWTKAAKGGLLEGGVAGKDSIPVMAMGGEYILDRTLTAKLNSYLGQSTGGNSNSIVINFGGLTIREEADIQKITNIVSREVTRRI